MAAAHCRVRSRHAWRPQWPPTSYGSRQQDVDVWLIILALVAALLVAASTACGRNEGGPAISYAAGTIVDVQSTSGEVRSFTLRNDGELVDISIADDVDYGFDLDHLKEHLASGAPVRCTLEERGGRLYALTILDF